ncbi:unnamed protein product [Camellia sinensis]
MDETIEEHGRSLAAPIIFTIVVAFQFIFRFIEQKKKKGSKSGVEAQLHVEIKQLYKEASSISHCLIPRGSTSNIEHVFISQSLVPSTFAQAAKLKRMALAKEKDLAKIQELHKREMKLSYDAYLKGLTILKWKVLSWRAGSPLNDNVMCRDYTMVDIIYQSQQNYLSKSLQLEGFATLKKIKDSGEIVVLPSLYLSKFIDF